ncbi:MAG: response regulator [Verrucomicrobia bacterium]|nr:response regulator [Verrucomicrobiota bacterium]
MNEEQTTILLADDDPNDVFLMKRAFKRAGYCNLLQVVQNGEEAVSYLVGDGCFQDRASFPLPSLVLLDLKMPRKSGLEVLKWIRSQNSGLRRVPVVVLTSSKQPVDVDRAYELGANSYLVKPVTFEKLLELVRTVNHYWMGVCTRPDISKLI